MCPPAFASMHGGVDNRIFPSSDHVPKSSEASSPEAATSPESPFTCEFSEKKKTTTTEEEQTFSCTFRVFSMWHRMNTKLLISFRRLADTFGLVTRFQTLHVVNTAAASEVSGEGTPRFLVVLAARDLWDREKERWFDEVC